LAPAAKAADDDLMFFADDDEKTTNQGEAERWLASRRKRFQSLYHGR
jgi:hypothetical protein